MKDEKYSRLKDAVKGVLKRTDSVFRQRAAAFLASIEIKTTCFSLK